MYVFLFIAVVMIDARENNGKNKGVLKHHQQTSIKPS